MQSSRKNKSGKQNILFLLNSPEGGATQGIIEFIKSYQGEQFSFHLLMPKQPDSRNMEIFDEFANKWTVVHLPWWNKSDSNAVKGFTTFLKKMVITFGRIRSTWKVMQLIKKWDIDTVYTGTIFTIEGALASKFLRKRHIWHIKETFGKKGRVKFYPTDKILIKILLAYSTHVVVMTEYIKSFFLTRSTHHKIKVIYDGVDVSLFDEIGKTKNIKPRMSEGIVVGVVASLSSKWKNHKYALEVAKKVVVENREIRFQFLGPIPKEGSSAFSYFTELKQFVLDNGLTNSITFGYEPSIPKIMSSIDILFHPCEIEPFGRVAIEAMACGVPVVGPNIGGISESAIHGKTGFLIDFENMNVVVDRILELASDNELRLQFGTNARSHVSSGRFSQDQHNQILSELLTSQ